MAGVSKAISEELLEKCKVALKLEGIRGENARRLQAIISAKEFGISAVARIYNISRETLMSWIKKFREKGVAAFAVAKGRGVKSKLSTEQKKILEEYIRKQGAHLSAKKLQAYIQISFDIQISTASSNRLYKELGFSYITPRPVHYKKDESLQEEFKKKSTRRDNKKSKS